MNREEFIETSQYFLRLIRSVLKGEIAPEKPERVNWKDIFTLSEQHYMTGIAYRAVSSLNKKPEEELLRRWERSYLMNVRLDIEQDAAWEEIRELFADSEVRLVPLKGLCLKPLWPESFMRVMSDLDIYCDEDVFPAVRKKLETAGYELERHTKNFYHKVFSRGNIHLEIHTALLPDHSPFRKYYGQISEKTVPSESPCVRFLTKEHEYVFLLIHGLKHFSGAGGGVRTVADFALFLERYGAGLDRSLIDREIAAADEIGASAGSEESVAAFEEEMIRQVGLWFGENDVQTDETGLSILSNGVYGRRENLVRKGIARNGKTKYVVSRIFPPYKTMVSAYPVLKKCPILLPFCWVARMIRALLFRRNNIRNECRTIKNVKDKH